MKIAKNELAYFDNLKTNFVNFSGNIGVNRKINNNISLAIALGRGMRSPNMLERFIKLMAVGYDNYDYLGNLQLKPEVNNEVDLTFYYNKESLGKLYVNAFYSFVQDYIYATLIPSSITKPQTSGVLGVKQFVNIPTAVFKGFELGYNTSDKYKVGGSIVAAYTHGILPSTTKYIINNNQVVGADIIKNDPLSEIPPFEATTSIYYKFLNNKIIPRITFRVVANQYNVSEALYEQKTSGFALFNFSLKYKINKYSSLTTGVNNILNRSYYEHLNRKIIGTTTNLYEPGRVFFINIYLNI